MMLSFSSLLHHEKSLLAFLVRIQFRASHLGISAYLAALTGAAVPSPTPGAIVPRMQIASPSLRLYGNPFLPRYGGIAQLSLSL